MPRQMAMVQNGRELLRLASPHQDSLHDGLLRIPLANRTIHLDCRPCTQEELAAQWSLFSLPTVDQNRWIHFRLQTPGLSEDFAARQPQASAIPKVTLTPGVSRFWKEPMRRPVPEALAELELAFIAIVQGNGGSAVKKVIVANEYPQIATTVFTEAVNGYSVVFTGACLRQELEKARDCGPNSLAVRWRKVTSLQEMFEMKGRARSRDENQRLIVGILC